MIPTAYTLPAAPETSTVPEGYQKAAYTVVEDPLDYYKDKKPSEKDLSQEKAAEMGGAAALEDVWCEAGRRYHLYGL